MFVKWFVSVVGGSIVSIVIISFVALVMLVVFLFCCVGIFRCMRVVLFC